MAAKRDDGDFHALRGQKVGSQRILVRPYAFVELVDSGAGHGPGHVQEEDAREARFGVFGEAVGSEDNLFHEGAPKATSKSKLNGSRGSDAKVILLPRRRDGPASLFQVCRD